MRAEQLRLALRPRPAYEAADLGARMTQEARRATVRAWLPLAVGLALACGSTIEIAPWLPGLLLWWLKPWLDRGLLEIYARQAFGQSTTLRDVLAARARTSWSYALWMLTLGRLSLARAYTMPVSLLEGQSGRARRKRISVIQHSQRGAAVMCQQILATGEFAFTLGLASLVVWFTPGLDTDGLSFVQALRDGTLPATAVMYAAQAAATLFVEPFYVAAGFAMYLNRRVELEAWDVEQDLRDAFEPR